MLGCSALRVEVRRYGQICDMRSGSTLLCPCLIGTPAKRASRRKTHWSRFGRLNFTVPLVSAVLGEKIPNVTMISVFGDRIPATVLPIAVPLVILNREITRVLEVPRRLKPASRVLGAMLVRLSAEEYALAMNRPSLIRRDFGDH